MRVGISQNREALQLIMGTLGKSMSFHFTGAMWYLTQHFSSFIGICRSQVGAGTLHSWLAAGDAGVAGMQATI